MPPPRAETGRRPATPHGLVESVQLRAVRGWLTVPPESPPVAVELAVNGQPIMSRWAVPDPAADPAGQLRRFQFNVLDLWQFTTPDDRIQVHADGSELPFAGGRLEARPPASGDEPLATLHDRLAEGYVFNSWGYLRLSKQLDVAWQRAVLDLHSRVDEYLQAEHGLTTFAMYGTLLGIVRENNFISHDYDYDCAYVSHERRPPAVRQELQRIAFGLIDAGFRVVGRRSCVWVRDPDSGVKIDVFHLYWDHAGHLALPFGVAGTSTFAGGDMGPLRTVPLGPGHVRIPERAEELVEHLYGEAWRTPEPAFYWRTKRRHRATKGLLSPAQVDEIYWADFYANTTLDSPSTFSELVLDQPRLPDVVVDIGCGNGRDTHEFARRGKTVVGLDRSAVALRQAQATTEALGQANAQFVACDVGDGDRLRSVLTKIRDDNDGRPMLLYARFLLHAVPEATQQALLSVVDEIAQDGDVLAAELRTDRDERTPKAHEAPYRRFQDGPALGAALEDGYGFEVRVEQEGNGFSRYEDEDPYLYRVIARRCGPDGAGREGRPRRGAQSPDHASASTPQAVRRRDRLARTLARDYAPPALTRWVRRRRADR